MACRSGGPLGPALTFEISISHLNRPPTIRKRQYDRRNERIYNIGSSTDRLTAVKTPITPSEDAESIVKLPKIPIV